MSDSFSSIMALAAIIVIVVRLSKPLADVVWVISLEEITGLLRMGSFSSGMAECCLVNEPYTARGFNFWKSWFGSTRLW